MIARRISALKYLMTLSLPVCLTIAFIYGNAWSWLPMAYAFGCIPLLELLFKPNGRNLEAAEEALVKNDPFYDWMVYLMVVVQLGFLGWFLNVIDRPDLLVYERIGLIFGMGLMCGVFGINVGHELGHRVKKHERFLSKVALMTSLYMHFYIEHNRGHHKHVATEEDPASARSGEWVYPFWIRSIVNSYRSAWHLENERLRKRNLPVISLKNEMIRFHLIQAAWLIAIGWLFGSTALISYLFARPWLAFSCLKPSTISNTTGSSAIASKAAAYERVQPHHSWNSNHILGRLLLFRTLPPFRSPLSGQP